MKNIKKIKTSIKKKLQGLTSLFKPVKVTIYTCKKILVTKFKFTINLCQEFFFDKKNFTWFSQHKQKNLGVKQRSSWINVVLLFIGMAISIWFYEIFPDQNGIENFDEINKKEENSDEINKKKEINYFEDFDNYKNNENSNSENSKNSDQNNSKK